MLPKERRKKEIKVIWDMVFEGWKGVQEKERKRKLTSSQKKQKDRFQQNEKQIYVIKKKRKGNPNQR